MCHNVKPIKDGNEFRYDIDFTGQGVIEPELFWEELPSWIENQLKFNPKRSDFFLKSYGVPVRIILDNGCSPWGFEMGVLLNQDNSVKGLWLTPNVDVEDAFYDKMVKSCKSLGILIR
jgi:hypothetical protein